MSLLEKITLLVLFLSLVSAHSSEESSEESSEKIPSSYQDLSNSSNAQDLYVIKTVIYEVGILTNASDNTDLPLNETHEQVDVTFFDPNHNGSVIDLSKIPIPIQTNVSGVSVTGVLPTNLGQIILPHNGSAVTLNGSFPIIPNKQIKVTQNISTDSPEKGSQIITNLPALLGLTAALNSSTPGTQ